MGVLPYVSLSDFKLLPAKYSRLAWRGWSRGTDAAWSFRIKKAVAPLSRVKGQIWRRPIVSLRQVVPLAMVSYKVEMNKGAEFVHLNACVLSP